MDYEQILRTDGAKEFRLPNGVTEDNWKSRMNFCSNLTEAINSYGREKLPKDFNAQIEPLLNNILECAVSERTQLSNSACRLLERLPELLEKDMHPHLDRLLPVLLKLCANTKQVIVKVAAAAVHGVITYSTYSPRMLWHICQVFEDKPAGPKIHATGWLQNILKDSYKSIDFNKDNRMISRAINLALEDADASVRTKARATYWTYSKVDQEAAQEIMEKLNNHAKTALQNDPSNPDKKAGSSKAQPPRPKSALADVRKEQARKKRAEEEALKQKKPLHNSTATHENIEIHEPRREKSKKDEKTHLSKATSTDRTVEGWQPPQKSSVSAPTVHKKALSQDHEVIAKPSANSRLLSAPVRRPRINITPMNAPTTNRPASRTGQNSTASREKEQQKDSRPASSHSWKSASANSNLTSPKRKPGSVISPKPTSTPATSPEAGTDSAEVAPPYVPDGKENRVAHVNKTAKNEDGSHETTHQSDLQQQKHQDTKSIRKPLAPASSLAQTPLDMDSMEYRISGTEKRQVKNQLRKEMDTAYRIEEHGQLHTNIRAMGVGYEDYYPEQQWPKVKMETREARLDLKAAQRFLVKNVNNIDRRTFDPLIFRKLKQIIEQYPETLIEDGSTYDKLLENLCMCLGSADDIEQDKATNHNNFVYNRSLILQMSVPLLKNYRSWSQKYWSVWIESMIYYRCTLTIESCDRRIKYIWQTIEKILEDHQQPLEFIVSVTMAITNGEEILLATTLDIEDELAEENKSHRPRPELELEEEESTPSTTPSQSYLGTREQIRVSSTATFASINPYSTRSNWKAIGEMMCPRVGNFPDEDAPGIIAKYMKKALNEHNIATIEHDRPYPRTLPLLIDFSLQVYTEILKRADKIGDRLSDKEAELLCAVAAKCLSSYDYMIKRSIVPFVKWVYKMMDQDEGKFFGFFPDENHRNLLEYYLFTSERSD